MATTTGKDIVDQARILLQDVTVGGVRWPDSEMLIWVNAGQREVAQWKPSASVKSEAVQLVEGTRQTLPTAGLYLIDITRNMGSAGTTPGRAVRIVEREVLDAQNPDWHSATASATAKHFVYNPEEPTAFFVYPPQPATDMGYIEEVYATVPADLSALTDTIELPDIYSNALVNYVLYRALSKDATYTKDGVDADQYFQTFLGAVGVIDQNQRKRDPNRSVGNPNSNFAASGENG